MRGQHLRNEKRSRSDAVLIATKTHVSRDHHSHANRNVLNVAVYSGGTRLGCHQAGIGSMS